MTTQGNVKGLDVLGQEVLWSSLGQQVMMRWEKQYMELCVEALDIRSTDSVLEIGFGLAYSASHIQTFRPKRHTIIECDQETLQRARQFAADHEGVEIVAGTWQQQLPTLGQFDCVFFDDYPLPELESGDPRAVWGGGGGQRSRWHEFLDVVLKHCSAGARISGYLARELDLQRSGCQVAVSRVQVDTPEHCNYFPHKTALVPVITVVDPAAAGGCGAGIESLPLLPHASKSFQRAFENANKSDLASFPRERAQVNEIREFLLAQEMDALSYEQTEKDEEDDVAMTDERFSGGRNDENEEEDGQRLHYSDAQSRREYLCSLRSKAAISKRTLQ